MSACLQGSRPCENVVYGLRSLFRYFGAGIGSHGLPWKVGQCTAAEPTPRCSAALVLIVGEREWRCPCEL